MIENAIRTSIISFVLGDVLGTPIQFTPRETLKGSNIVDLIKKDSNLGLWSDDTSMTLCTMQSICENGDWADTVKYFLKWLNEGYMTPEGKTFDVGRTTRKSLQKYLNQDGTMKENITPEGLKQVNANGNGSLMRILPVSLYCYFRKFSADKTFETVKNYSGITHAHPISILGCYIYTMIVFDILNGKTKNEIVLNLGNIEGLIPQEYKQWLKVYHRLTAGTTAIAEADDIDSSGYVKSTLETALWGFYKTNSTEECIFKIIELGEDTDTNGAVGGSLSGLFYGLKGAEPEQEWVDKIIKIEMIMSMTNEFIEKLTGE